TEDGEPDDHNADNTDSPDNTDDGDDAATAAGAVPTGPVGDRDILTDLGLSEKELLALDTDAMAEIADALGVADVLETVR
ncbi:hypothetical protein ACWF94_38725, partial [Streptomyces sp. NPDC055078]